MKQLKKKYLEKDISPKLRQKMFDELKSKTENY